MGSGPVGGVPSSGGGECLSKGSYPILMQVLEKITENSEQFGQQARPGIKPGTSLNNFGSNEFEQCINKEI